MKSACVGVLSIIELKYIYLIFCYVFTDWRKLRLESVRDWCSVGTQATTTTYTLVIYVTKHIKLWSV